MMRLTAADGHEARYENKLPRDRHTRKHSESLKSTHGAYSERKAHRRAKRKADIRISEKN
jgi:hypothetical protein